jgi:apolipoprotein N-acyltransferase
MHRLPLWARAAWLGLLALPLGAAELGPANQADAVDGARLRVAAVQPAIDERDRHVPKQLLRNLGRLLDLTDARLARHSDLVVWPESAWERVLGPGGDAFLAAIAHGLDTPLVSGAWVRERAPGGRWKNAAVLATRDGTTAVVAEKVHPVPVYERAPDTWITRRLAGAGLWSGHFSRGMPRGPLLLPTARKPGAVGVLVCIDASYPELARSLRRAGAQLLVTLSNEAGTGSWSATLHARITRLRAIENRMPVVRVGNTGPTQWIDARGRVVAELAPGRPAAASHALLLAGPIPPFVRIGDRGVVAASLLSALAMVAMRLGDSRRGVER